MKDIRTALANAIAEAQDGTYSTQSPSEANLSSEQSLRDRQALGGTGATTPGSLGSHNPFQQAQSGAPLIQRNSRSIRRLMSEKSFTMDTVYSGMIMDGDLPSEPLEVNSRLPASRAIHAVHEPTVPDCS